MAERPISRQPECHVCGHETHLFACDWCLCEHDVAPGIYDDNPEVA